MKAILNFKFIGVVLLATLYCSACKNNNSDAAEATKNSSKSVNNFVTINTFEINGGWGYDILINDTLYIHQSHIPAVNGLFVFATEVEALRVADVVAEKINNNIIPPTIEVAELKNMGIIFQESVTQ